MGGKSTDGFLEQFRVDVRTEDGGVVVAPVGELDLATVGAVEQEVARLRSEGNTALVMDLRAVTFIDSSGVRMLLDAHRELTGGLTVIDGEKAVSRAFDVMGVRSILRFSGS
jgi:anti-anti-sigma factor